MKNKGRIQNVRAVPAPLHRHGRDTTVVAQRAPRSFPVEETTIAQIHAAMRERPAAPAARWSTVYLKRIDAYDKTRAALNAMVVRQSERNESRPTSWIAASRKAD